MEDAQGVAVEAQELRKVNMDGATESTLQDNSTLQESGVTNGTTLFWVTHADGDIALFATNNQDGCKMASCTGSETIVMTAEEGQEQDTSNWWERQGTSSGVLAGSGQLRAEAGFPPNSPSNRPSACDDSQATEAADRAKVALAAEVRLALENRAAVAAEKEEVAAAAAEAAEDGEGTAWLAIGRRVTIRGLRSAKAQHLNGCNATVVGHLVHLERYLLALDGGQGQVKIKRCNVFRVAAPRKATKQPAARKLRVAGGGVAVDPVVMQEALMQEARAARQRCASSLEFADACSL